MQASRREPAELTIKNMQFATSFIALGLALPAMYQQWVEQAKLLASDAFVGDAFGASVAVSGDTALVGASKGDGSGTAYVFVRTGTSWVQQAKLVAGDAAFEDQFGFAVSLEGDTALIGAPGDDHSGAVDCGSAYVFSRAGTSWAQQAKIQASDPTTDDRFGTAVSLSGNTALVGASLYDSIFLADIGAAYVFVRAGTQWSQQAKLTASDNNSTAHFGNSVALEGDTALIGSNWDSTTVWHTGSVYHFARTGATWNQKQKLVASDADTVNRFGSAIALSGSTALIGASDDDTFGILSGSAYVFAYDATAWGEQAKLFASDAATGDKFGEFLSLSGDLAVIGARGDDVLAPDSGSIYAFLRSGTTWSEYEKVTASDAVPRGYFGGSLSLSGDTVLVGARGDDEEGYRAGAAYVFTWEHVASATFRNAGSNPASHDAVTLPVLGATYRVAIDVGGTTGHNVGWLVGYEAPLSLILGGGQALLVDPAGSSGELLMQSPQLGPLATYDIPIPADLTLLGFEASTQALHAGGIQPFALSNAQDLYLGH